ncbi:MAG: hypothetical protein ACYC7F_02455 [Gemmatimonadaceae bacterium]
MPRNAAQAETFPPQSATTSVKGKFRASSETRLYLDRIAPDISDDFSRFLRSRLGLPSTKIRAGKSATELVDKSLSSGLVPDAPLSHLLRLVAAELKAARTTRTFRLCLQYVGPIVIYYVRTEAGEILGYPIVQYDESFVEGAYVKTRQSEATVACDLTFLYYFLFVPKATDAGFRLDSESWSYRRSYRYQFDLQVTAPDAAVPDQKDVFTFAGEAVLEFNGDFGLRWVSLPTRNRQGAYEAPSRGQAEWKQESRQNLLLASAHVVNALASLSETWTNPSLKKLLVIAPPGSGKEEIGKFLSAGFDCGYQSTLALPGQAFDDVLDYLQRGYDRNVRMYWLDEVDKASAKVRSALLRVLEGGVLPPLSTGAPISTVAQGVAGARIDRAAVTTDERATSGAQNGRPAGTGAEGEERLIKHVNFLLSAAAPFASLVSQEEFYPPDFWTRVELAVEIPHPFAVPRGARSTVVEQYCRMFLMRELDGSAKNKAGTKTDFLSRVEELYGSAARRDLQQLTDDRKLRLMVSHAMARPLARMSEVRLPSIRVVRTIVGRALWATIAHAYGGVRSQVMESSNDSRWPAVGRLDFSDDHGFGVWCNQLIPVLFLESYA